MPSVGSPTARGQPFSAKMVERGQARLPAERLVRTAGPSGFRRELSGTAFFVDDAGHMLTARHAVEACARVVVAKEGRAWAARVVSLSPRADIALIKVPKTFGLSAVFPRKVSVAANDLMFAAAYDNLPTMIVHGGIIANATVAAARNSSESGDLELESNAGFGTSGAPVLDSRGLVEGVVSRRVMVNRVQAVGAAEAKAFLFGEGIRPNEDDRPQLSGAASRANRASSISARVTCLQD